MQIMPYIYLLTISFCYVIYGKPVQQQDINLDSSGLEFLHERGYLKVNSQIGEIIGLPKIVAALKKFQYFAGLEETGVFDEKTKEFMNTPRCGKPDIENEEDAARRRRFVAQGTKWKKSLLTWALENSNNDDISNSDVRRIFHLSLDKWKEVTNMDFRELVNEPEDSADIRVRFGTGKHKTCDYAFDGQGGALAHAFYPLNNIGLSGDVHYDDDEVFTIQGNPPVGQYKLLWITVHELGHSLGLAHSSKKGAIMFPYYQHFDGDDFTLTDDDIRGIQSIYGARVTPQSTSTTPTSRTTTDAKPKKECTNIIKAAYLDESRKLHVFNYDKHYVLNNEKGGVESGPYPVSSYFDKTNSVDATFRRHTDNKIIVFHGNTFSVYDGTKRSESPRHIENGFQGLGVNVQKVDAAMIWPSNNKLYIFIGEYYWGMTLLSSLDYLADFGYPKKISVSWLGLPDSIDDVFTWINNEVYFTKGEDYYRWDKRRGEVRAGYPQKLGRSFLRC